MADAKNAKDDLLLGQHMRAFVRDPQGYETKEDTHVCMAEVGDVPLDARVGEAV